MTDSFGDQEDSGPKELPVNLLHTANKIFRYERPNHFPLGIRYLPIPW